MGKDNLFRGGWHFSQNLPVWCLEDPEIGEKTNSHHCKGVGGIKSYKWKATTSNLEDLMKMTRGEQ